METTKNDNGPAAEPVSAPISTTKTEPRPQRHGEEMDAKVAEGLLDNVLEWLEGHGGNSDRDDVLKSLTDAIDRAGDDDGYAIAKALDDEGWAGIDADFVEILNEASWLRGQAHDDAVREWVKRNAVAAPLPVGAKVRIAFKRHPDDGAEGAIAAINDDLATYVVACPSLGHVPEGQFGTHGLLIPFENVVAVQP